ncbi:DUF4241 domain-containing protein [Agrobacterium sp. rho-8.1]|nr:DUF4241 domain-containing protein [Agrobacterium sp. rho-8.1]
MMRRWFLKTFAGGLGLWASSKPELGEATIIREAERDELNNFKLVSLDEEELAKRQISALDVGEVVIHSGRIRACDPLSYPDFPQLERQVPRGQYAVRLYKAFGRVAVATLRIAEGTPTVWESAKHEGRGEYRNMPVIGYPVDAGMGSYADSDAFAQMTRRIAAVASTAGDTSVNYYDDVVASELKDDDWVLHRPMADNALNVAMFSSGWGDGYYSVYWGLSDTGSPLVLLTDFVVLENADGRKEPD